MTKIKKSAGFDWVLFRRIVQYVSLAIFLALFILTQRDSPYEDIVNIPMQLDPLVVIANWLASRQILEWTLLALIVIVLSLVLGRSWCGWLCPMGTILDLFSPKRVRTGPANTSDSWRKVKYSLLIVILVAAVFTNLTLLIFDPLTLVFRTLTTGILPALDRIVLAVEKALYPVSWLQAPINAIDVLLRPVVLPEVPLYYRYSFLYVLVFAAIIALNFIAQRFWCRYLCPLGGLVGLLSKFTLVRRQVKDTCQDCHRCERICPTGTIRADKGYASDPAECTMCMDCLKACPHDAIDFPLKPPSPAWNSYDPGRRQALEVFGTTVLGVGLLNSELIARHTSPHAIQPPGGRENDLLSKCIRCGECVRVCPTSAIQLAATEVGLEGLMTPILIPRLGYCEYSCNACGLVCPVEAIPPMALEAKRQQVIGNAYIDENRCIAWADHGDCIVCEEMCPIPDKAIKLEVVEVVRADGTVGPVKLPHVERERCIGCGICENKCPVNGDAAIRVYVATQDIPLS